MRWESDVPLDSLARYRIGGPVQRLCRPKSLEALRKGLRAASDAGYKILGTGANILISDRGLDCSVLVLRGELDYVRVENGAIEVGAAARLPALAGTARRLALRGFHFLEAVPGTIGGGLRMNAGSRDDWLWHCVEWAELMTPEGELVRMSPAEVAPSYRHVDVPDDWVFVAARFSAPKGEIAAIKEAHMSFRERKVRDQVYELPSIGSTWKNPPTPYPSAWLIVNEVGMRGAKIGGAQIAERHSNFIVNLGGARADDVLGLMAETRRRAREHFGLWLEPEIHFWGFDPERLATVGAT